MYNTNEYNYELERFSKYHKDNPNEAISVYYYKLQIYDTFTKQYNKFHELLNEFLLIHNSLKCQNKFSLIKSKTNNFIALRSSNDFYKNFITATLFFEDNRYYIFQLVTNVGKWKMDDWTIEDNIEDIVKFLKDLERQIDFLNELLNEKNRL
jgi:hypothetical protein